MRAERWSRGAAVLWVAVLLAGGIGYASWCTFSTVLPYDDEGTLLLSVREVEGGAALYDDVFSAYGPFYYLWRHICHGLLGAPINHDFNRLLTVVLWIAIAATAGFLVRRLTGSLLVASVVYLQMLRHAQTLTFEPGHPQAIIALLLMTAALLFTGGDGTRIWRAAALGGVVAAVALSKINIGVFLALSLSFVFTAFAVDTGLRRGGTALAAILALALPSLLLRRHLDTPWGQGYAVVVTAAWTALVIAARRAPRAPVFARRDLAAVGAGCALVAALAVGFAITTGSSLGAILDATLLDPIRFPLSFVRPDRLGASLRGAAPLLTSAAAVLAAMLFALARGAFADGVPAAQIALGTAKLIFAGAVFYLANHSGALLLAAALPWLWVAIPGVAGRPPAPLPRLALTAIAALQALQAYPIAGSQLYWSTFLLLPAAGLCAVDAWELLLPVRWRHAETGRLIAARRLALLGVFTGVAGFYWKKLNLPRARAGYENARPLNLPGAEHIRVHALFAGYYQWWVANLRASCDAFVAIPGYCSLYFWTEIRPLTGLNAGAWAMRLGDEPQSRKLARLRRVDRLCVLRQTSHGIYAVPTGGEGPLLDYINQSLVPGLERYRHVLLVRPQRAPLPVYLSFGQNFAAGDRHYATLPSDLFPRDGDRAVGTWFRTDTAGVLLGGQTQEACEPFTPGAGGSGAWAPILYVGTDGRARGSFGSAPQAVLASSRRVDDGAWHHLVLSRRGALETLYVDGALAAEQKSGRAFAATCAQVGVGYTRGWPQGNDAWSELAGDVAEMTLSAPLDASAVRKAFARGPRFFATVTPSMTGRKATAP